MGTVGGGVTKPPGPVGKLSISVLMGIALRSMSDPCLRESEEAQRHGGHRTKQNENNKGSGFWIPLGEAYCEDSSILAIQQRQALLAHLHGPNLQQQTAREGASSPGHGHLQIPPGRSRRTDRSPLSPSRHCQVSPHLLHNICDCSHFFPMSISPNYEGHIIFDCVKVELSTVRSTLNTQLVCRTNN